jgi:phosphoribosyl-ATP pyrophosphohydrolase
MDIEEVKPLVVRTEKGEILDVTFMNEKSYTKSRERGELWHLNRETGRVLPHPGEGSLLSLRVQSTWYEALMDSPAASPTSAGSAASVGSAANRQAATRGPAADPQPAPDRASADAGSGDTQVLLRLEKTIDTRRRELPEGSYTTHLFTSGEEKIRKKTGEEAVELILARSREEVAYEAADLIYHLLVLLCVLDIPLESVLQQLASREEGGSG